MMESAVRACPFTQAKMFHVFVSMAATRTELARGEGLPDPHDGLPVPVGLILEHPMEFRPADLGDRLAQLAVLLHVLHLQGLDADDVVVFDDLCRHLVQEVGASVGDLLMDACDFPLLLLVVLRLGKSHLLVQGDELTTGQLALLPRQFLLEGAEVTVVLVECAVR